MTIGAYVLILWLSIGGNDRGGVAMHEFRDRMSCEQVGFAAQKKWGVHRADFMCVPGIKD